MTEAFAGRSVVLDGELVVAGEGGRPDFYALSTRLSASRELTVERLRRSTPVTFVAFDLLWLDGQLTTQLPYVERRRLLEELQLAGPAWQTTPSYPGAGAELLAACASLQLEGCLYKDLEAPYRPGIRCRKAWIKQKCPAWVAEHAPRRRPGHRGPERASAAGRPDDDGIARTLVPGLAVAGRHGAPVGPVFQPRGHVPLYEVTDEGLKRRPTAAFAALAKLGMYEKADLQRLLRDDISALDEDLFVIAEEFGNWEDARRRIDLLALDKAGRLVVIELKRTDDGGHMELQAIRYAAMVSAMGFTEVADAYAAHRAKHRPDTEGTARAELAAFLDLGEGAEEPVISTDLRIVLVSADFGREITTTVLWLNGFEVLLG